MSKQKEFKPAALEKGITALARGERLSARYRDHALSGTLTGFRECHVQNDILLVYQLVKDELILVLVDLGTHSSLFGR
jgi:mRNA interferase YafQ